MSERSSNERGGEKAPRTIHERYPRKKKIRRGILPGEEDFLRKNKRNAPEKGKCRKLLSKANPRSKGVVR